jgi:hypothetical protein
VIDPPRSDLAPAAAPRAPWPPNRTVHCGDAIAWLSAQPQLPGCSLVTSLPDRAELPGMSPEVWTAWFTGAAALVLSRTPEDGCAIFFQSDVRRGGLWVDKAYLVQRAAEREGVPLLFHKIVCRKPAGTITHGRAAYSHLLCFSRGVRPDLSRASPDVLPDGGEMTWVRAIGLRACRLACSFVLQETRSHTIVDPFCGLGTVLAVANELGLGAVGVELNRKRAARAKGLQL